MGDVILTTPFIRSLRRAFPESEIDFVTRKEYAELLLHHPSVSHVVGIDVSRGIRELLAVNRRFRNAPYDFVYDLHDSARTRVLRYRAGKYLRVVRKNRIRRFLLVRFGIPMPPGIPSVPLRYLATATAEGVQPDAQGPEVFVPQDIRDDTHRRVSAMLPKGGSPIVGICPGAKHETKRWPVEYFSRIQQRLAGVGARILLFGGPDEAALCRSLWGNATESTVDLCGTLTLLETAAAMDLCDVIVANDSGLMHLASARMRPVVALFGCTVRAFGFFPYNTTAVVHEVEGLPCRPCSHIGRMRCPKKHFRCMKEIDPADVFTSVLRFLPPPPWGGR
ncbi:MAG: glycosyltransferase family 9 protein [Bacteroidota bacterium]|nr:glycosyltransferase family 9 protein [Bacteroidota bacterium]